MLTEYSFFLGMISDHIFRRNTIEITIPIDWNMLMHLAQIHQVDGILFFQCKKFLPGEIRTILEERYGTTLFLSANRMKMVTRLTDALESENIEYFVIKGSEVAAYYPFPVLRTMGDTDLVVHTEDRSRVHEIFIEQGYKNESKLVDREWIYWKNQIEFELHDKLVYEETINVNSHEEFFNDFWGYVNDGNLDWSFHLLYLILHLRKHLMNYGVGFRQFMDIAVITKNNKKIDWTWIEDKLIQLDMIEFARTVFALNEAWFGVNSPIHKKELDDVFYEQATEQVFNNGVFGFNNEENRDNAVVNIARSSDMAKISMTSSALQKLFPSYNSLVIVDQYKFLKGKKWLLPVVWIYRFGRCIKNRHFKRGIQDVKSSFVSSAVIERRSEWLEKWGL